MAEEHEKSELERDLEEKRRRTAMGIPLPAPRRSELQRDLEARGVEVRNGPPPTITEDRTARINNLDGEFRLLRTRVDALYRRKAVSEEATNATPGNAVEWEVEMDGGSPGDAPTAVLTSFTYTLKDTETGATIATGVALTGRGQRLFAIEMTPGTRGRGYYDENGDPVLTWVDETMETQECQEEE